MGSGLDGPGSPMANKLGPGTMNTKSGFTNPNTFGQALDNSIGDGSGFPLVFHSLREKTEFNFSIFV
jgi:hypothetical protein